jgi:hypothetical protein
MKREREEKTYMIERFLFQQNALFLRREKFAYRTNSAFFFLSRFLLHIRLFAFLYNKRSVHEREWESEYPISYTHIALYMMWVEKRDRKKKSPMRINHAFIIFNYQSYSRLRKDWKSRKFIDTRFYHFWKVKFIRQIFY